MAKEPESKKLPIQTAVARGISNSKRVKAIELSTSMIAKDVFAIKPSATVSEATGPS